MEAEHRRRERSTRRRAVGGGPHFELPIRDPLLLTAIWLRHHPRQDVVRLCFGIGPPTAGRCIQALCRYWSKLAGIRCAVQIQVDDNVLGE